MHGYAEVDNLGGFSIQGLAPGAYEIRASAAPPGGGDAIGASTRADAGATGLRVELSPGR
jgi:hypothetical protein